MTLSPRSTAALRLSGFEVFGEDLGPADLPLQPMLAVVDFPEWSVGDDDHLVPELRVWRVGD